MSTRHGRKLRFLFIVPGNSGKSTVHAWNLSLYVYSYRWPIFFKNRKTLLTSVDSRAVLLVSPCSPTSWPLLAPLASKRVFIRTSLPCGAWENTALLKCYPHSLPQTSDIMSLVTVHSRFRILLHPENNFHFQFPLCFYFVEINLK